ncbi:sugar ABC transporter substrate-binding protein [Anaerobium acetethylicum]|uniref:Inositol transport system substrate-binding protein n=1 Tax=Anaerobium acetethylicum TaxID=1619234 RepID=A0A1D3TY15_9FIRM|nr:sugar ABC transporter substrate-binding protein [Anaerobium acetethylicum]SCP99269.1 inositol transport system substrate-binding protein [Anaerobium acetethylicum]
MKKIMKKVLAVGLVLAMTFSLAACGSSSDKSSDASSETAGDNEKYKVLFVCRNRADVFAARLANSFQDYYEGNYSDKFTFDIQDAQADNDKENQIIDQAVVAGYDCIIVQPNDSESQTPSVKAAVEAGVKVITTNAGIRDIEGASWVDADPYEQGKVIAELAVKDAPQNARVVIMSCNPGNLHTESRLSAFHDIFVKERTDVDILAEKICTQSDSATFMQTMEDWVQAYGKIDVCLTIGDDLAKACYEVVKNDATYAETQYYAVDANPDALLRIKLGNQTATVMQDTAELAQKNLDGAWKLLSGEEDTVEDTIETILITADNVDKYIEYYIEQGALTQKEYDEVLAEIGAK